MDFTHISQCAESTHTSDSDIYETLNYLVNLWNKTPDVSPQFLRQILASTFEHLTTIGTKYKHHNLESETKHILDRIERQLDKNVTSIVDHVTHVKDELTSQVSCRFDETHKTLKTELSQVKSDLSSRADDRLDIVKRSLSLDLTESIRAVPSQLPDFIKAIEQTQERADVVLSNKFLTSKLDTIEHINNLSQTISKVETELQSITKQMNIVDQQRTLSDVLLTTKTIHTDLQRAMEMLNSKPTLKTNEEKRVEGEDFIETELRSSLPPPRYEITRTAKDACQMDLHIRTPGRLLIGIDVKNWNRTVDSSETIKSKNLMDTHAIMNIGIVVSMRTNIETYSSPYYELRGKNKMLWFFPNAENNVDGLIQLIKTCDAFAKYITYECTDTTKTESVLTFLGPKFQSIMERMKRFRDSDMGLRQIQAALNSAKKQVYNHDLQFNDLISEIEEILCVQFGYVHQIQDSAPIVKSPQRKRKKVEPTVRAKKLQKD